MIKQLQLRAHNGIVLIHEKETHAEIWRALIPRHKANTVRSHSYVDSRTVKPPKQRKVVIIRAYEVEEIETHCLNDPKFQL